jgi:hypothetical protein
MNEQELRDNHEKALRMKARARGEAVPATEVPEEPVAVEPVGETPDWLQSITQPDEG